MSTIAHPRWRTAKPRVPVRASELEVYYFASPTADVEWVASPNPNRWRQWLIASWRYLRAGDKLPVPRQLAHPRHAGFARPRLAEPAGQSGDWVLSLSDGSRLHLHEHENGTIVAHRDAVDPARGMLAAAWHFVREARLGKAAVGALAVAVIATR